MIRLPSLHVSELDDTQTHTITARGLDAVEFLETTVKLQRGSAPAKEAKLGLTPLVVGTDSTCELVSDDPVVSRRHCQVLRDPAGFRVRDLKSKNGCRVSGVRVVDVFLQPGQVLELGASRLWIEVGPTPTEVPLVPASTFGEVVGSGVVMRALFKVLERAAATEATVLLSGETGSGKDAVARSIHAASARGDGPFVVCDCSTLAPNLIESELFGHVKGAFSGATSNREGLFVEANEGTLFLDEVGELPLELQPKLLRALEARKVRPVGGATERPVDVRIIAATHRDLREGIGKGTFRQDLYFRLGVIEVRVPPLRERLDDLPLLAEHFLSRMSPPVTLAQLPPNALKLLEAYDWPGNVRELRNVLERLVISGKVEHLAETVLPLLPWHEARAEALAKFEISHLKRALAQSNGSLAAAARALGVSRQLVHQLVTRHGL